MSKKDTTSENVGNLHPRLSERLKKLKKGLSLQIISEEGEIDIKLIQLIVKGVRNFSVDELACILFGIGCFAEDLAGTEADGMITEIHALLEAKYDGPSRVIIVHNDSQQPNASTINVPELSEPKVPVADPDESLRNEIKRLLNNRGIQSVAKLTELLNKEMKLVKNNKIHHTAVHQWVFHRVATLNSAAIAALYNVISEL